MTIDYGTMFAQLLVFMILFALTYLIFSFVYKRFSKKSNIQQRIEQLEKEVSELKNKLGK